MAGEPGRASRWGASLLLGGLALAVVLRPACEEPGEEDPFDAGALLQQASAGVILPALRAFADAAAPALADATGAYAAARGAGEDGEAERAAAREAFHLAFDAWQEIELFVVGPAAPVGEPGGAGLRDAIYSFPTVNPCLVDQRVGDEGYAADDFFASGRVNSYGFDALEYLLFPPGDGNACPAQATLNSSGAWAALGAEVVRDRRAAYAAVVAARIAQDGRQLLGAWDPDDGDFAAALAAPGAEGSPFASDREAVQALFEALFAIETGTKDRKLGQALGLGDCALDLCPSVCAEDPCPDAAESPFADRSVRNVRVNLEAARALFSGADGAGFDDLLASYGNEALATQVLGAFDAALAAADATPDPLEETLAGDPAAVRALYDAVKGATDLLKGELATILVLQIPSEAASDND